MAKNKGGRPTVLTRETIAKLKQAFSIDATITEACFYADIADSSYYRWKEKNPKLSEDVERLRNKPILKARKEVVDGLIGYKNSMDYLSRKRKDEFSQTSNIDHTTGGEKLNIYIPDNNRA